MEPVIAILIGLLAACGTYLLLARNLFRILLGLGLIAQAANLLVFCAAGLGTGTTAVVAPGETQLPEDHPDPLAQALVLTAIVISFGVTAFFLVLAYRSYQELGTDNMDQLRGNEGND